MAYHFLSFAFIRLFTFPMAWLSYATIHKIGSALGTLAYYLMPKFRKRALSNLSLAKDLCLCEDEIILYAKNLFKIS